MTKSQMHQMQKYGYTDSDVRFIFVDGSILFTKFLSKISRRIGRKGGITTIHSNVEGKVIKIQ